jgi:LmbE family N-acetylglucosaminyl deacetylase
MLTERFSKFANRALDYIASPGTLKLEAPLKNPNYQETQEFRALLDKIGCVHSNIFFISPHLDDAVLSAGSLISYLSQLSRVTVVSTMTEYDPSTSIGLNWMEKCGYTNPSDYMKRRREEDFLAVNKLGAKVIHIGLADMTSGKTDVSESMKAKLLEIISPNKQTSSFVFAPTAIGRQHPDHHLVNRIVREITPNPILWEEFSLTQRPKPNDFDQLSDPMSSIWEGNYDPKIEAIMLYKTQVDSLFPKRRVSLQHERYFFSRNILNTNSSF